MINELGYEQKYFIAFNVVFLLCQCVASPPASNLSSSWGALCLATGTFIHMDVGVRTHTSICAEQVHSAVAEALLSAAGANVLHRSCWPRESEEIRGRIKCLCDSQFPFSSWLVVASFYMGLSRFPWDLPFAATSLLVGTLWYALVFSIALMAEPILLVRVRLQSFQCVLFSPLAAALTWCKYGRNLHSMACQPPGRSDSFWRWCGPCGLLACMPCPSPHLSNEIPSNEYFFSFKNIETKNKNIFTYKFDNIHLLQSEWYSR